MKIQPKGMFLLCFLLAAATAAFAQRSFFANLPDAQFDEMREKCDAMSSAQLEKAATDGDAVAQYFYWRRLRDQADQDCSDAACRSAGVRRSLSDQDAEAAEKKWNGVDDAQLRIAAANGDKGAQMVAIWRECLRALDRGSNAVVWAEKSADQRFPPAEYDVGVGRLQEASWQIMDADRPKGIEFLQRAADDGWPPALYKFAKLTIAGEKLPPNPSKAVEYLRKATDRGGPRSAYELANLYAQGTGEPRNLDDSPVALLRRSAATRYPPALYALAERYRLGLGVSTDYIQAIRYYQAARDAKGVFNELETEQACDLADQDLQPHPKAPPEWKGFAIALSTYLQAVDRDPDATERLGEWYQTGTYVPVDPAAAYFWLDRAATLGVAGAAEKSEAIKATLQPEQLRQAARTNRPLRFQPSDLSY